MSPVRIGLWVAGLLAGVGALVLIVTSDHVDGAAVSGPFTVAVGWTFIAAGLVAWERTPTNRSGLLMTLVGFAWFAGALSAANQSLPFTIGTAVGALYLAVFAHLLLAYPSGRLEPGPARTVVMAAYVAVSLPMVAFLLFATPEAAGCDSCPNNVLLVDDDWDVARGILGVDMLLGTVIALAVVAVLVRRFRRATRPARRMLAPVLVAGALAFILVVVTLVVVAVNDDLAEWVNYAGLIAFGAVPLAFLAGLLRTRLVRSAAVGSLVLELGETPEPGQLRDALRRALHDPSLRVAYWLPDRGYVDLVGQPYELPAEGPGRAITVVQRAGRPVAALEHDPSVRDDPGLLDAVCAAAGLALENERLSAELRARLEELRASRARLVEASDAERRRLERNLHDGAQQRLVSLSLAMRLARTRIHSDPDAADALLAGAATELQMALAELRELARGIHPAILSDRGLSAALEALAGRAPIPVDLREAPVEPLPAPVEAAAYFVVSEALANVAKYAHASSVAVSVNRMNGLAVVEVEDDGVGGADPKRGSGLRGLADRVEALDGRLRVESPPGGGTRIRAEIPCG